MCLIILINRIYFDGNCQNSVLHLKKHNIMSEKNKLNTVQELFRFFQFALK